MCINCCISLNTSIYSANLSCSDQPSYGMYPSSTVTVSQPYANRWRNVGPTATTIVGATLLCSLGQRCAYVNSQPSANVAPTISQRYPNHQPTLPQPSANVAPTISQLCPNHQPTLHPTISQRCTIHMRTLPQPFAKVPPTIRQRYPNHPPKLPQPSANVASTIFQCVPNLQKRTCL